MREKLIPSEDWRDEDFYIPKLGSETLKQRWSRRDEVEDYALYALADAAREVARGMTSTQKNQREKVLIRLDVWGLLIPQEDC